MQTRKTNFVSSQINLTAEAWKSIRNASTPADRWLGNFFHKNRKKIGSRDRRFISECIYSLFRNKLFYESWCRTCSPQDDAYFMAVLAAAFEGLINEKDFSQAISGPKTADLFRALQKGEMIQENDSESPVQNLSLTYSFPEWLTARWIDSFGEKKCESLLAAFSQRPPLAVRANTIKTTRHQLMKLFSKAGYEVTETPYAEQGILFSERENLFGSEEFKRGFFEVQDEGSQLICQIMNPKPGESVWDMCAGAGGKSLALAAVMKNKGRVLATDIRKNKIVDLKKRAKRAGVFNVFPADMDRLDETKFFKKGMDKILIDAPCSGTGTLRRNPDAKWKLTPEVFKEHQETQKDLIRRALEYSQKNELIFYVTCSIERAENEEVIETVCVESGAQIVPVREYAPDVAPALCQGDFLRIWPDEHGMDGFFMAILRKNADIKKQRQGIVSEA